MFAKRNVKAAAVGKGTCPSRRSRARLARRRCNRHRCPVSRSRVLKCKTKTDVIMLLDGSGSVGTKGWDATLKFAEMFLGGFKGEDVRASVILFSGPRSWSDYYKCERGQFSGSSRQQKCGITMVQSLTTDIDGTITKVKQLKFPRLSTYTAAALAMAKAELKLSRGDAKKVVLVMTDGVPISSWKTQRMARRVKRQARLMFGAIKLRGRGLNLMRRLATYPVSQNVMRIHSYKQLDKTATMNGLMRDLCGKVSNRR